MKKRLFAALLAVALVVPTLASCGGSSSDGEDGEKKSTGIFHDSKEDSKATVDVTKTDYDPKKEVEAFKMGELSDAEKDKVIEMGYFNCDHMVGAIIGEKAGIYEALGLKVNVTKSGETLKALTSGAMDVGYVGIEGSIRAANNGAKIQMAAANHMGGSRYLVVNPKYTDVKELLGKTLAISAKYDISPEWLTWADKIGVSATMGDYNQVTMGQQDAMFALKAGQIDGFTCCDPYASIAEFEGFGKIMGIGWGGADPDKENTADTWGLCCVYMMSEDFKTNCPELARRLVFAHELAIKYLYEHPYNAAMMFADGFDVDPYVGLRTVYMKTVAEGRTLTWKFSKKNVENFEKYYTQYSNIPEEEIPKVANVDAFLESEISVDAGLEDFDDYIKEKIDPIFPVGTSFQQWYEKAKTIDGISDDKAVDITKTATPYLD